MAGEGKRSRLEAAAGSERALHYVSPGDIITADTGFMRCTTEQQNDVRYKRHVPGPPPRIICARYNTTMLFLLQGSWYIFSGWSADSVSGWSCGKSE